MEQLLGAQLSTLTQCYIRILPHLHVQHADAYTNTGTSSNTRTRKEPTLLPLKIRCKNKINLQHVTVTDIDGFPRQCLYL